MPDWYEELKTLFKEQIGKGEMDGTAYDTAWVASIPDLERPDRPAFPQALEWLRLHQNSDGSWGTEIEYYHDRVMSTLIACIVLAEWRSDEWVDYQIESGLRSIWRNATALSRDSWEPIGFELILPTLLGRARALNFSLPYPQLSQYEAQRKEKLALLPPQLIHSRHVTSTFSLEFLGDEVDISRFDSDLYEANDSIAGSPSATSYFVRLTGDCRGIKYLSDIVKHAKGAIPTAAPIDIFERAWSLYNIFLVKGNYPTEANRTIEELASLWTEMGVGFSRFYSIPDLDETAMAFAVLARAGRQPDYTAFGRYEKDDHFICFPYERGASVSAHIHLLDALAISNPFPGRDRMIGKVLHFLKKNRVFDTFWFDKWHFSPYYTTAHAILAGLVLAPELVNDAIAWLIHTQHPDGYWGYTYGTVEETAYSLQALAYCYRRGISVPLNSLEKGARFLQKTLEHRKMRYPGLWISKTLYAPVWVIHTTALSALAMYEDIANGGREN